MKKIILLILSLVLIISMLSGCQAEVDNKQVESNTVSENSDVTAVTRAELGEANIRAERDNINKSAKGEGYELIVKSHKLSKITLTPEVKSKMQFENDKILILDVIMDLKNISKNEIDTSQDLMLITIGDDMSAQTMLSFLDNEDSRVFDPGETREIAASFVFDMEELPVVEDYILKFTDLDVEVEI